ncbi:MAG: ATP-binding protein [Candidatus Promineifilaceae bacterium]
MSSGKSQPSFAEEFERVLIETDTSIRRLSRLSDIPRRTLENWLYGRSQRPRHVEPILTVARALHLPAGDANRLLAAAGYPTIEELVRDRSVQNPQLLEDWIVAPNTLIGQQQTALASQPNLPGANTPFLGRTELRRELSAMLRNPELRLVTVSGLGGVGKTRLALETARDMSGWFDHGVYFIPLDNVNDAQGFWQAVLNGLGIPGNGVDSAQKLVEEYARNKQLLLLLDNFEHLLAHTNEISRLLARTLRLKMLVTSRQALDMRAEQLFPIGGLSYAAGQDSPAYELFVGTARRRVPDYLPSPAEAANIVQLCTFVEGLPLAIELAATWSDVLSPAQIMDHLTRNLRDVWHGAADRPDRQKSLWALFDYSWQMLPAAEKEAAMRLSILRGSFTAPTALAVAGCEPAVLKLLIQTSVVGRTASSRLMIHPLVRQFLAQQAVRAGYDLEDLEERYMEVILQWASAQTSHLRKTLKVSYYQNLYNESQHFDRAWWLAVKRGRYDLLESCWDIIVYFESRGTWGRAEAFFAATRLQIPVLERRMHALLDEAEAVFAMRLYELSRALKLARRSLQTLAELGVDGSDNEPGAYARLVLLTTEYAISRNEATPEAMLAAREESGNYLSRSTQVIAAVIAGVTEYTRGNFAGASASFLGALALAGPDTYVIPNLRYYLAMSLLGEGRESQAREQFELSLKRALEIGIYPAVVSATYELCILEGDGGSTQRCREALEDLALQMGSRYTIGRVAIIYGVQYLYLGHAGRGTQLMRIGMAMAWNEVEPAERRRILSTIAQAYIAFGLAKTAPQVLALVAPKGAPARI